MWPTCEIAMLGGVLFLAFFMFFARYIVVCAVVGFFDVKGQLTWEFYKYHLIDEKSEKKQK